MRSPSPSVFSDVGAKTSNEATGERNNRSNDSYEATCEEKILKRMTVMLGGIPPPPSSLCKMTCSEMLDRIKENQDKFGLPCCPNPVVDAHPKVYYLNSGKTSEEISDLTMRLIGRLVPYETASSYTYSAVIEKRESASARKRRLYNGLSPGRRLSHLARRRQIFSKANLQQMAQNEPKIRAIQTNVPRRNVTKEFLDKQAAFPRNLPKRALFQSPDEPPVRPGYKTVQKLAPRRRLFNAQEEPSQVLPPVGGGSYDVSGWLASQPFNGGRKRCREESGHDSNRKRKCPRRSLDFSTGSPSKSSEASSESRVEKQTYMDSALKKRLLWAVSVAYKEKNIHNKDPEFVPCATALFNLAKKNIKTILRAETGDRTSDKLLKYARDNAFQVAANLGLSHKLSKQKPLTPVTQSSLNKNPGSRDVVYEGKENVPSTPKMKHKVRSWKTCLKAVRQSNLIRCRSFENLLEREGARDSFVWLGKRNLMMNAGGKRKREDSIENLATPVKEVHVTGSQVIDETPEKDSPVKFGSELYGNILAVRPVRSDYEERVLVEATPVKNTHLNLDSSQVIEETPEKCDSPANVDSSELCTPSKLDTSDCVPGSQEEKKGLSFPALVKGPNFVPGAFLTPEKRSILDESREILVENRSLTRVADLLCADQPGIVPADIFDDVHIGAPLETDELDGCQKSPDLFQQSPEKISSASSKVELIAQVLQDVASPLEEEAKEGCEVQTQGETPPEDEITPVQCQVEDVQREEICLSNQDQKIKELPEVSSCVEVSSTENEKESLAVDLRTIPIEDTTTSVLCESKNEAFVLKDRSSIFKDALESIAVPEVSSYIEVANMSHQDTSDIKEESSKNQEQQIEMVPEVSSYVEVANVMECNVTKTIPESEISESNLDDSPTKLIRLFEDTSPKEKLAVHDLAENSESPEESETSSPVAPAQDMDVSYDHSPVSYPDWDKDMGNSPLDLSISEQQGDETARNVSTLNRFVDSDVDVTGIESDDEEEAKDGLCTSTPFTALTKRFVRRSSWTIEKLPGLRVRVRSSEQWDIAEREIPEANGNENNVRSTMPSIDMANEPESSLLVNNTFLRRISQGGSATSKESYTLNELRDCLAIEKTLGHDDSDLSFYEPDSESESEPEKVSYNFEEKVFSDNATDANIYVRENEVEISPEITIQCYRSKKKSRTDSIEDDIPLAMLVSETSRDAGRKTPCRRRKKTESWDEDVPLSHHITPRAEKVRKTPGKSINKSDNCQTPKSRKSAAKTPKSRVKTPRRKKGESRVEDESDDELPLSCLSRKKERKVLFSEVSRDSLNPVNEVSNQSYTLRSAMKRRTGQREEVVRHFGEISDQKQRAPFSNLTSATDSCGPKKALFQNENSVSRKSAEEVFDDLLAEHRSSQMGMQEVPKITLSDNSETNQNWSEAATVDVCESGKVESAGESFETSKKTDEIFDALIAEHKSESVNRLLSARLDTASAGESLLTLQTATTAIDSENHFSPSNSSEMLAFNAKRSDENHSEGTADVITVEKTPQGDKSKPKLSLEDYKARKPTPESPPRPKKIYHIKLKSRERRHKSAESRRRSSYDDGFDSCSTISETSDASRELEQKKRAEAQNFLNAVASVSCIYEEEARKAMEIADREERSRKLQKFDSVRESCQDLIQQFCAQYPDVRELLPS